MRYYGKKSFMIKFKKLKMNDKGLLKLYPSTFEPSICELGLANIFIWCDLKRIEYSVINDNLCLLANPGYETKYFFEPLGENKIHETVRYCLKHTPSMICIVYYYQPFE